MNVVIFLLWFGMICVPQFYYQSRTDTRPLSNTTCLIPTMSPSLFLSSNFTCTNESINRLTTMVYSIPSHCIQRVSSVKIRECVIEGGEGVKESTIIHTVSNTLINNSCMVVSESNDLTNNDYYDMALANATVYSVCIGVSARVEWYQHILDFISGTGFFNETLLFQGVYPNTSIGGYNISLAFLFVTGIIYGLGVILLVYK